MGNEVTGVVDEKDGALTVGEGDKAVRYVKESDLLTIKGSRDTLQTKLSEAEVAKATATEESKAAAAKVDEATNAKTQAEAKVESLTEDIKKHTGTTEELTRLQTELATAQEAGKSSATELLELRRTFIINTYKVPPETVKEKSLGQLKLFEEALKAVVGGAGGNYAFGGGGGGSQSLEGKSPMELAQMAYRGTQSK